MYISKDKLGIRMAAATAIGMLSAVSVSAQSTPTELADMALEDLLNLDITADNSEDKARSKVTFSYSYRQLNVGGYKTGTQDLSFQDVLFSPGEVRTNSNFPVVPTFITQRVHAFSANYAINDKYSVQAVLPYIRQSTEHISSVPGFADFTLWSKGVGDVGLTGSYRKNLSENEALLFSGGVRIPTGSISKTGDTPRNGTGTLEQLPYTMQIGSGTWDFTASAQYSRKLGDLTGNLSANTTVRTGKNKYDYRLGNNYAVSGSLQLDNHAVFQPGLKASIRRIDSIHGGDLSLTVPAAFPYPASITNPDNYGGEKAYISGTLNVCVKRDCSVSLSGEYGRPIYQNLNGVQPKDDDFISLAATARF